MFITKSWQGLVGPSHRIKVEKNKEEKQENKNHTSSCSNILLSKPIIVELFVAETSEPETTKKEKTILHNHS